MAILLQDAGCEEIVNDTDRALGTAQEVNKVGRSNQCEIE